MYAYLDTKILTTPGESKREHDSLHNFIHKKNCPKHVNAYNAKLRVETSQKPNKKARKHQTSPVAAGMQCTVNILIGKWKCNTSSRIVQDLKIEN